MIEINRVVPELRIIGIGGINRNQIIDLGIGVRRAMPE
jgi:hypothetical protein